MATNAPIQGIDLYDLYQSLQSTVNFFVGGWWRPSTDFAKKANDISNDLWVKWTDEAEKSQEARDNLIYFLQSQNIIVQNQKTYYGTFSPPPNYGRYASARLIVGPDGKTVPSKSVNGGKCYAKGAQVSVLLKTQAQLTEDYYNETKEVPVINVDNARWGSFLEHKTKGPTFKKPGITQVDGNFKVSPREVSVVVLDYYALPTNAVFAYTIAPGNAQTGAGDFLIYQPPPASTLLQWPNSVRGEFIIRLGEIYSLFTREQYMSSFFNQDKKTA